MIALIDIDLIVCDKCNVLLKNEDIISNKEYEILISDVFNYAFPLETTKLIVKCKECGTLIFTLQRLTYYGLSS